MVLFRFRETKGGFGFDRNQFWVSVGRTLRGRALRGRTLRGRALRGRALRGRTLRGRALQGRALLYRHSVVFVGTIRTKIDLPLQ